MTGFSKNVVTPKGLVPQQILVSLAKGWIVEGSRSWEVDFGICYLTLIDLDQFM